MKNDGWGNRPSPVASEKVKAFIEKRGGPEAIKAEDRGYRGNNISTKQWRAMAQYYNNRGRYHKEERNLKTSTMEECEEEARAFLLDKGITDAPQVTVEVVANLIYLMRMGQPSAVQLRAAEDLANIDGRLGLKPRAAEPIKAEDDNEAFSEDAVLDGIANDPTLRAKMLAKLGGNGDGTISDGPEVGLGG